MRPFISDVDEEAVNANEKISEKNQNQKEQSREKLE